jgi:hypothetical protein
MDVPTRDWLFDYHKEAYKYQLDRTDKIRDRISLLSSLLTLLGGGVVYVFLNYPHNLEACSCLWFYAPATFAILLFVIAICQVLYCLGWGFTYHYTTDSAGVQNFAEGMVSYAKEIPTEKVDVVQEIKANLIEKYAEAASYNLAVNSRRANLLLRATQIAIASFMLLLLALPAFFYQRAQQEPNPTKVIITEPMKVKQ